jgi:hypothetical protein
MKKIILLSLLLNTVFLSETVLYGQSTTMAPNYVVIPGVPTLPACAIADKGKTVFNTTDNKMYFCDGTAWQGMAGVPSAGVGWSQTGANITNTNTGIVTVNSATYPATNAIFGSNGNGISLQKDFPTIGFNQYRDAANNQRYIGNGYAMGLFMAPSSGTMLWNSNPSGTAGSLTSSETSLMALSTNGKLGIGVLTPEEKLTVSTLPDNYGMLHKGSGISVGSYVSSVGGAFGTKTNHPFSLFANNSAAALTVKTNADIEISNGFYAAGTGSLNLIPLGVFKVSYFINSSGDLSNLVINNVVGDVLTGGYTYSKFLAVNDFSTLSLVVNSNAIPVIYTKIIVTGTPMSTASDWTNVSASFNSLSSSSAYTPNDDSRADFINHNFNIKFSIDSFISNKIFGTFIVYGIK